MAKKVYLSPSVEFLYPAPTLLVTCASGGEGANIITIAWAGVSCSEPPMLSISVRPERHSHHLILSSREFGVNVPKKGDLEKVDFCGVTSGKKVDKFDRCGFTPFQGKVIRTPLIRECPVNLECRVVHTLELGTHTLFLGKVEAVHLDEVLFNREELDMRGADPIVYLPPTAEYASLGEFLGRYCLSRGRV